MDKLIEFIEKKQGASIMIVLCILGVISSGVIFLFTFNKSLFLELDWIKLLFLIVTIPTPLIFIFLFFFMCLGHFIKKFELNRVNIPIQIIVSVFSSTLFIYLQSVDKFLSPKMTINDMITSSLRGIFFMFGFILALGFIQKRKDKKAK